MSESGQRQRVIRVLKRLHGVAIENPLGPGTPDVNYVLGWIELKWLRRWPMKETTTVQLPHFTLQQRRWLRDRWKVGADNAWLLLQVQREWLLFTGIDAHDYVGLLTRGGLYKIARVRWKQGLIDKELEECLIQDWENWNGSPIVRPSSSTVAEMAGAN